MRISCTRWWALAALVALVGCNDRPDMAPVTGRVLYNGQPLPYGSIVFQPPRGQLAAAAIQTDGSFRLSTFAENDGAIVGPHKVSVTCYTSQRPSEKTQKKVGEATLGELLIPSQYTFLEQSGLSAEVPPSGADDLVFELTGPKRDFPM